MINALHLASDIIRDPDSALALFQLIAWVRANRGDPSHEAEADDVEDYIYSRTELCAKHKETDKRAFLVQAVKTTSSGS